MLIIAVTAICSRYHKTRHAVLQRVSYNSAAKSCDRGTDLVVVWGEKHSPGTYILFIILRVVIKNCRLNSFTEASVRPYIQ